MLGLKLIHVSKRGQCWKIRRILTELPIKTWHRCIVHCIVFMHMVLNLPMVIIKTSLKIIARLMCIAVCDQDVALERILCILWMFEPTPVISYRRYPVGSINYFKLGFIYKKAVFHLNGSVFFLFHYQMSALHPGNVYVMFLFLRNACISWKLFF